MLAGELAIFHNPLQTPLLTAREVIELLVEPAPGPLALFNAAGQADLFFEGKQLYASDLLQVLPYRIVGLDPGVGQRFGSCLELPALDITVQDLKVRVDLSVEIVA